MANSGNILFPTSGGGSGLPQLTWVKGVNTLQTVQTGQVVECSMFYPRVPIVNQSLIDNGQLFVQFGRTMGRHYSFAGNPGKQQIKGNSIHWYSSILGGNPVYKTSGSGEIGGGDVNTAAIVDRPNLIPVTNTNQILTQAIPVWTFYKVITVPVFNGDPSVSGLSYLDVPVMTGKGVKRIINYDNYLPGNSFYKKRPQRPAFSARNFSTSTWFCRLVVIKDGKVTEYGPISNPVIIRPNGLPFSLQKMNSKGLTYTFTTLKGEELTEYNG